MACKTSRQVPDSLPRAFFKFSLPPAPVSRGVFFDGIPPPAITPMPASTSLLSRLRLFAYSGLHLIEPRVHTPHRVVLTTPSRLGKRVVCDRTSGALTGWHKGRVSRQMNDEEIDLGKTI